MELLIVDLFFFSLFCSSIAAFLASVLLSSACFPPIPDLLLVFFLTCFCLPPVVTFSISSFFLIFSSSFFFLISSNLLEEIFCLLFYNTSWTFLLAPFHCLLKPSARAWGGRLPLFFRFYCRFFFFSTFLAPSLLVLYCPCPGFLALYSICL